MPGFTDHIRCSLCLEEVEYLENPKQLPCSHFFCLGCLESNVITVESSVKVQCCVCSLTHELHSLESLTTVTTEGCIPDQDSPDQETTEDTTVESDVHPIFCDQCQSPEGSSAVCYCETCDKKLCKHHEKAHQDFFTDGDRHRIISAQKYQEMPKLYMRPKCVDHSFDIGICCELCRCFRCPKCTLTDLCKGKRIICVQCGNSDDESTAGEGGRLCWLCRPEFEPPVEDSAAIKYEDMKTIINKKFAEQLKCCSQKITDMCKKEKESWLQIDNLEQECEQLIEQVDTKEQELIQGIHEESCRLKQCIEEFKIIYSARIENNLEIMRQSREYLDGLRCETEKFLLQNHVTELIEHEQEKIDELKQICEEKCNVVDIDMGSLRDGLKKFTEYEFSFIPDTLVFLSEVRTDGHCYSVTFCDDGSLLQADQNGVHRLKFPYCNDSETLIDDMHGVTSVSWSDEYCYTVSGDDLYSEHLKDCNYVKLWNLHQDNTVIPFIDEESEQLFKFDFYNGEVSFITSDFKDTVIVTAEKSFLVYNTATKKLETKSFDFQPANPYFNKNDGTFLVSDGYALRKYELNKENELILKWTCPNLPRAAGVCVTKLGQIIVRSGYYENHLYLVSNDGEFGSKFERKLSKSLFWFP